MYVIANPKGVAISHNYKTYEIAASLTLLAMTVVLK